VGGGDHAHVDADRRLTAHAIELALSQHTQQPRLQRGRHVADLIEKQRAAVGLLEAAAAQTVGAGEGALLVAEQLGLEQLGRNRRSVQRNERLVRARAVLVQCTRGELLAGTRLARDQHVHARARQAADGAEHLLHRRRAAEQLRDRRRRHRTLDAAHAGSGGALDQIDGLVDVEGLGKIFEGAALVGRDRAAQVRVRRHDDDRQLRMGIMDPAQQIESRLSGHPNVGNQHIRCVIAQRCERGLRGIERLGHHAAVLERAFEHPAYGGVVIDQPDTQWLSSHSAPSSGSKSEKSV
jgi:hypothetical protein